MGPTLDNRQIETRVVLADGEVGVIGMSQEQVETVTDSGTPFLRDIPTIRTLTSAHSESVRDLKSRLNEQNADLSRIAGANETLANAIAQGGVRPAGPTNGGGSGGSRKPVRRGSDKWGWHLNAALDAIEETP